MAGYTLIELIVVMALISILLAFAVPRISDVQVMDQSKAFSRWLTVKIQVLKEQALTEQRLYTLHIGMDVGRIWITHEGMTETEIEKAEEGEFELSDDVRILDVEYPTKGKIAFGRADISFYKNGYSDKVLIHVEDADNQPRTYLIEPFLSRIKIYDDHVGFDGE